MELTNQVCSLELSQRLKELGVKQGSLFYRFQGEGHQYIFCKYYEQYSPHVDLDINDGYSAFTVSELGKMIPKYLNFNIEFDNSGKWMIHFCVNKDDHAISFNDENLASLIAKTLIYLLENGYIKNE